jgi:lipopolysaccharide/colanic/teichoic acid biosynthesis glycosyltransferase
LLRAGAAAGALSALGALAGVRAGLVCLREVHGRSNLSFERWIELDLIYIAYRSLRTDLRILWHLVPAVLRAEGAY